MRLRRSKASQSNQTSSGHETAQLPASTLATSSAKNCLLLTLPEELIQSIIDEVVLDDLERVVRASRDRTWLRGRPGHEPWTTAPREQWYGFDAGSAPMGSTGLYMTCHFFHTRVRRTYLSIARSLTRADGPVRAAVIFWWNRELELERTARNCRQNPTIKQATSWNQQAAPRKQVGRALKALAAGIPPHGLDRRLELLQEARCRAARDWMAVDRDAQPGRHSAAELQDKAYRGLCCFGRRRLEHEHKMHYRVFHQPSQSWYGVHRSHIAHYDYVKPRTHSLAPKGTVLTCWRGRDYYFWGYEFPPDWHFTGS